MLKAGTLVYLTKSALTAGIIAEKLADDQKEGSDRVYLVGHNFSSFRLGTEIFETPQAAVAAANKIREKRLKSLQKQMLALQKLEFKVPEDQP